MHWLLIRLLRFKLNQVVKAIGDTLKPETTDDGDNLIACLDRLKRSAAVRCLLSSFRRRLRFTHPGSLCGQDIALVIFLVLRRPALVAGIGVRRFVSLFFADDSVRFGEEIDDLLHRIGTDLFVVKDFRAVQVGLEDH